MTALVQATFMRARAPADDDGEQAGKFAAVAA